jgi:hypothetical protein
LKGAEIRPSPVAAALEEAGYVSIPLYRGKTTDRWYVEATINGTPARPPVWQAFLKWISLIHTKSGEDHGIDKLDGDRLTLASPFFTASKRNYPPAEFCSTPDGDVTVVTFEKEP